MQRVCVLEVIGKRPVGGVGTIMLNYQKYINRENVRMDYLIFGEEGEAFDAQVRNLGSKVYCCPALSGRQLAKVGQYFENFFREHKGEYHVVHLHAPYIAFLCFPAAKKYGIEHCIVHSHATVYAESRGKALRNRFLWKLSRRYVTERIGCSEAAGRFLFGRENYIVLKNAICCEDYSYDKQRRNYIRERENVGECLVVGNVGRFSRQKNQTYLLDIFYEISKIQPKSVLWLVGDGELRQQLEQKTEALGLKGSVKFFGQVAEVKDLYQAMDVMVMPSLFEGLPMTGVEAQACGLPCVFADTITREAGFSVCSYLSLAQRPEEWAKEAIRRASCYDAEGRERRSCTGELRERGFDIRAEAGKLERLYLGIAQ